MLKTFFNFFNTRGRLRLHLLMASIFLSTALLSAQPKPLAVILGEGADVGTTETSLMSGTIAANTIQSGTVYRVMVFGACTTPASPLTLGYWRVRIGPTTLTGSAVAASSPLLVASQTYKNFYIDMYVTFITNGAAATSQGFSILTSADLLAHGTVSSGAGDSGHVDTTISNLIEATFQTTNSGTCTAYGGFIHLIS